MPDMAICEDNQYQQGKIMNEKDGDHFLER